MTITLIDCVAIGNRGDGLRIEGDIDLKAVNFHAAGNGGQGINVLKHAGIMQKFGLPIDTDPRILAELLIAIRNAPSQEKAEVIKRSSLWGKFAVGILNTTTLISNLVEIAGSPQAALIIAALLK